LAVYQKSTAGSHLGAKEQCRRERLSTVGRSRPGRENLPEAGGGGGRKLPAKCAQGYVLVYVIGLAKTEGDTGAGRGPICLGSRLPGIRPQLSRQ
jgi:hypothetical protein